MAKKPRLTPQPYPRTPEGLLDENALVGHSRAITDAELKTLIRDAIEAAARKSSRAILSIGEQATAEEILATYVREGRALFRYFHKYVSDPAATAHQLRGKHYRDVGLDQFRKWTAKQQRKQARRRNQYLAIEAANATGRFDSVSEIGAAEGDFNAVVRFADTVKHPHALRLVVSVQNRSSSMDGHEWPEAIQALENDANDGKNNRPFCFVLGIAMEPGLRNIRNHQSDGQPHSSNTEVWRSDFFWPFFSAHSYEEIMTLVLDVLLEMNVAAPTMIEIVPSDELLDNFGQQCAAAGLLDEDSRFSDPYRLLHFFVNPLP